MSSEVKGAWFATARRFLTEQAPPEALDRVARAMSAQHREALVEPIGSQWYPEAALQELLAALFETEAEGDLERFTDLMRRSTVVGIGRFFRVLMSLGSFRFVMRNVPTMWGRLRRGAGEVSVVFEDEDRVAVIRYRAFPYFDDPLYRALTLGSLTGMAEVAAGGAASVDLVDFGSDHLTVRVVRLDD